MDYRFPVLPTPTPPCLGVLHICTPHNLRFNKKIAWLLVFICSNFVFVFVQKWSQFWFCRTVEDWWISKDPERMRIGSWDHPQTGPDPEALLLPLPRGLLLRVLNETTGLRQKVQLKKEQTEQGHLHRLDCSRRENLHLWQMTQMSMILMWKESSCAMLIKERLNKGKCHLKWICQNAWHICCKYQHYL